MSIRLFQVRPRGNFPLDTDASTLDEMTRELSEGFYTTFTTLCGGAKVLGLAAHLQRLYSPAKGIGVIPAIHALALRARIATLAKETLPNESRIRLILTKDSGAIFVGIQPFEPLASDIYSMGVHVITSETSRRDPRIKNTAFISASISQRKLLNTKVFEVLLTKNGRILEGMTSNFYAIKGGTLVTAQRGILLGVTRKAILRLARGQGMSVEYRALRINEKFNEAFLTSSSRGVVPIVSIDQMSVGEGKAGKWTKILSKAYQDYVEERSEWIVNRASD